MIKTPTQPTKETPKQREAFLIYFNQGGERSLKNVCQEIAKTLPKKTKMNSLLVRIKEWSTKFKWVERVQRMDQEVAERSEEIAIKEATVKKSDILKACKNTMIKYNQQLLAGDIVPTATDFRKMWEIMRIEIGKPIGQEAMAMAPTVNIFLTKNEKILKVVARTREEIKQALLEEIENENE